MLLLVGQGRCAGMGGLQQITVNCGEQNIKTEKSPLSTPASSEAVRPWRFSIATLDERTPVRRKRQFLQRVTDPQRTGLGMRTEGVRGQRRDVF